MSLPKDPIILLSYVNTKLRDYYSTLGDFCVSEDIDENELKEKLAKVGYTYDMAKNTFIYRNMAK